MAIDKSKYDKEEKIFIKDSFEEYENYEYPSYIGWQEYVEDSYYYDYYTNSDGIKLCVPFGIQYERQLKLNELLDLDKNPTIGDIFPKDLK